MKRKVIQINHELCNGCGLCLPNCPEGALQIIDGKARLISDLFCDGLGACIGHCPEGAIQILEREALPYDERMVMENIIKQGESVIRAHLGHLRDHGESDLLAQAEAVLKEKEIAVPENRKAEQHHNGGCPGSRERVNNLNPSNSSLSERPSELRQWPIQLALVNLRASFLDGSDLVVAADCVAFSYASFHERFLKGKALLMFCPKLDSQLQEYTEKLTQIFKTKSIRSVTVVHMEVPCCFGVGRIVEAAMEESGMKIPLNDITITIEGSVVL